jgi:predicted DNA binding CopG/RHH family protein
MTGKIKAKKLKPLPVFASDSAAETFVDRGDLTKFDLSKGRGMRFEFDRKSAQINLRMPEGLLASVKLRAKRRGIPYQRFIREVLEKALG